MAGEILIRVDDSGRGDQLLAALADGNLLDTLAAETTNEARAQHLLDNYGIEISPWLLESLPSRHAIQALRAQVTALEYETVRAGPADLHVVFCLLFPFPLPFFRLSEGGDE